MLGLVVPLAVIFYLLQVVVAIDGPFFNHHYGIQEDNLSLFSNVSNYLDNPQAAALDWVPASYVYTVIHGQSATNDYHWTLLHGKHPHPRPRPEVCAEYNPKEFQRQPTELLEWWRKQQKRDGGKWVRTPKDHAVQQQQDGDDNTASASADGSGSPPHVGKRAVEWMSFTDHEQLLKHEDRVENRAPNVPTKSQDLDSALHGTNLAAAAQAHIKGRSHHMIFERRREQPQPQPKPHDKPPQNTNANSTTPQQQPHDDDKPKKSEDDKKQPPTSEEPTTKSNSTTPSNVTHAGDDSIKGGPSDLQPFVPPAPRWNGYSCCALTDYLGNLTNEFPSTREMIGMNVITLAFLTSNTTSFRAQKWFNYTVEERRRIVDLYHSKGISIFLSTFGGDPEEEPVTKGYDPVALGNLHGEIAYASGFDGLDNDLEDFEAFSWFNKSLPAWTAEYTRAVRRWLPAKGGFGMSAAPVAPWFTPNRTTYCHGAYNEINKQVGHLYDFYNVQFYNQGVGTYDDCSHLLFHSNISAFQETSVFEIAKNGVGLDKVLIAKPGWPVDAGSGYVPPEKLSYCLHLAKSKGWKGGAASWQFPHAGPQWWRELRMDSFFDEGLFAKRPVD